MSKAEEWKVKIEKAIQEAREDSTEQTTDGQALVFADDSVLDGLNISLKPYISRKAVWNLHPKNN